MLSFQVKMTMFFILLSQCGAALQSPLGVPRILSLSDCDGQACPSSTACVQIGTRRRCLPFLRDSAECESGSCVCSLSKLQAFDGSRAFCTEGQSCFKTEGLPPHCSTKVLLGQTCRDIRGCHCRKGSHESPTLFLVEPSGVCPHQESPRNAEKATFISDKKPCLKRACVCDSRSNPTKVDPEYSLLVKYLHTCKVNPGQSLPESVPHLHEGEIAPAGGSICSEGVWPGEDEAVHDICKKGEMCAVVAGQGFCLKIHQYKDMKETSRDPYGFKVAYLNPTGALTLHYCLPFETFTIQKDLVYCKAASKPHYLQLGEICFNAGEGCYCPDEFREKWELCRVGYKCSAAKDDFGLMTTPICERKFVHVDCEGPGACDCTPRFGESWASNKPVCNVADPKKGVYVYLRDEQKNDPTFAFLRRETIVQGVRKQLREDKLRFEPTQYRRLAVASNSDWEGLI